MWGTIINRSRDIARQGSQWLAAEPQLSKALCRWTGAAGSPAFNDTGRWCGSSLMLHVAEPNTPIAVSMRVHSMRCAVSGLVGCKQNVGALACQSSSTHLCHWRYIAMLHQLPPPLLLLVLILHCLATCSGIPHCPDGIAEGRRQHG
jgi:hypothetical protein